MYFQKEATHTGVYHLGLVLNQEYKRADQRDSDTSNESGGSAGESAHNLQFSCHKHIRDLG